LDNEVRQRFQPDYQKWDRMIALIARVNRVFCDDDSGSIYNMSYANPFNVIPLRTVAFVCFFFFDLDCLWLLTV
jgi:hypothetical protein